MKKRILIVAAVIVCLALLGAGTLAYFTDEATAHNVITSNGIDIELEEWQDPDGDGEDLQPYPSDPIPVMPGTSLSKIVLVRNKDAESWIRASVKIVITDAEGKTMELTQEQLDEVISLDINDTDWTEDGGWYYYNAPVAKDGSTEPLFTTVTFSGPNMTNEYQNCTVEIIVSAQATQYANNGETVMEAAGWPDEEIPTETEIPTEAPAI